MSKYEGNHGRYDAKGVPIVVARDVLMGKQCSQCSGSKRTTEIVCCRKYSYDGCCCGEAVEEEVNCGCGLALEQVCQSLCDAARKFVATIQQKDDGG